MPDSTMIYVTHDQVEAMTLASRIVVLANKGIAQVGTPLELYETPRTEFVAQFIGSPAMNLMPGRITATGAETQVALKHGAGSIRAAIPTTESDKGLEVNVGIRPEDMTVAEGDDYAFAGTVEISEALGEVTQIYFSKPEPSAAGVIAKLSGIHRGMRGQTLRLSADPGKLHLFHKGASLLYR